MNSCPGSVSRIFWARDERVFPLLSQRPKARMRNSTFRCLRDTGSSFPLQLASISCESVVVFFFRPVSKSIFVGSAFVSGVGVFFDCLPVLVVTLFVEFLCRFEVSVLR